MNERNALVRVPEASYPDTPYAPIPLSPTWKATMGRQGQRSSKALMCICGYPRSWLEVWEAVLD